MKPYWAFLFLFFLLTELAVGQKVSFNRDWQFCRLDELGSIGYNSVDWQTNWYPGYVASVTSLAVPADSLKKEQKILRNKAWENVVLPHTAFIEPLVIQHQWQGICYYRKYFQVNTEWKGKKIFVNFGGAMQLADVWVNGQHVMQHAGGYDPFMIDLTDKVLFDKVNEIVVRLDNRNNPLIPHGRPIEVMDFMYYSGIYRDVDLIVKDSLHITNPIYSDKVAGGGIFVTYPFVSEEKATVKIKTNVFNETVHTENFSIVSTIVELTPGIKEGERFFTEGKVVGQKSIICSLDEGKDGEFVSEICVPNPNLWFPDSPNLYLLTTKVTANGKVIDEEQCRIGIRKIEITKKDGFAINGKPLRLVGTNRHMDYPYVGNAISDRAQYRDLYKVKEGGFNIVRLSHYPQDPSALDACDELGLLVIEPIPGWQFYNKDTTFCELTFRDTRNMIRRDRNHPSIVMWETMLNESGPTVEWKDLVVKIAHEEYPGDQCYTSGDSYGYDGFDVCYNDWKEGFIRANNTEKPGFIREHYDYEFGGEKSTTRKNRGDGEFALLQNVWNAQWSHNHYRSQYPWTCGDAVWSMYDYNRGCHDFICKSGVSDIFRLPKFSWWFFRLQQPVGSQLAKSRMKPELFIANYWTKREGTGKVVVFGNVEEVALKVNGEVVGRKKCDNGPDSPYARNDDEFREGGNPFDKGNCRNLTYPPFTFTDIQWEKGTLDAVGYINGKEVTKQKILNPDIPAKLEIRVDESGKKWAKGDDPVFVYVSVVDKNGTLCVEDTPEINLSISGDATIVGGDKKKAEAGIATFLVRSGSKEGKVKFEAKREDHSARLSYLLY